MLFPSGYRSKIAIATFSALSLLALNACEDEPPATRAIAAVPTDSSTDKSRESAVLADAQATQRQQTKASQQPQPAELEPTEPPSLSGNTTNPRSTVGNNQYMFDISGHSREELMALLKRADEVAAVSAPETDNLGITLILDGPNIGWFAKQDYENNKELVDLAARLDALKVIDLKVSQQTVRHYGYSESEIPDFIDRVSFAPEEMRRLENSEYFKL